MMTWQPRILVHKITNALEELCDEGRQQTIWLGADPEIVVLPWEVHYDLLSGSHFSLIKSLGGDPVISKDIDIALEIISNKFANLIDKCEEDVELIINSSEMIEIRFLATDILGEINLNISKDTKH